MRVDSSRFIPVLFDFADDEARQRCWGRFLELRADGARLITRSLVERGWRLRLRFDLPGEWIEGVLADVRDADRDEDGYYVCDLRFGAEEDRVRLGRALRRILV
ncbi:MAG: hypothetical protein ABII00_10465 [Elusimicrobiota bacterium]